MSDILTNITLSSSPTVLARIQASCTVSSHSMTPPAVKLWDSFQSDAEMWCKEISLSLQDRVSENVLRSRPPKALVIVEESSIYSYFDMEIKPGFDSLVGPDGIGPKLAIDHGRLENGQADRSVRDTISDRVLVAIEIKHSQALSSSIMKAPLHEYVAPRDSILEKKKVKKTGSQKVI